MFLLTAKTLVLLLQRVVSIKETGTAISNLINVEIASIGSPQHFKYEKTSSATANLLCFLFRNLLFLKQYYNKNIIFK